MTAEIPQWMVEHEIADNKRFEDMQTAMSLLATKQDMKKLATEESVRELVHLQRNFMMAAELVRGGGKWMYRAIQVLAVLIGALAVITGAWKGIIAWALSRAV